MISLIETTLYIILCCYSLSILSILIGWFILHHRETDTRFSPITVSVVIAARNESDTLPGILHDLSCQEYPARFFDVIIVDDHSDVPLVHLKQIIPDRGTNLIIFSLPEDKQGKKEALLEGVKLSNAELILFTDADCRVGPKWISSFVRHYKLKFSHVIIGLVDYDFKPGISQSFFRADLISLVMIGAGTASMGYPTICNGANMAVRRDAYLKHANQLKKHLLSGDDVFLLHAVKRDVRGVISVIKNKHSIVITQPPRNILEFFSQRARWASKGIRYKDYQTVLLAFLVLLSNLSMVFAIILCVSGTILFLNAIALYSIKTITDCFLLAAGFSYFGRRKTIILIPFYELIYPFYILIAILLGTFNLFTWKKRS
jgi:cellulose synthase/poly-beta-1,6-N-acetylglucosamine synthase-like glycosyltransferase